MLILQKKRKKVKKRMQSKQMRAVSNKANKLFFKRALSFLTACKQIFKCCFFLIVMKNFFKCKLVFLLLVKLYFLSFINLLSTFN